jgi:RNA polymerase sigma-70 factor (ECF subfamily)
MGDARWSNLNDTAMMTRDEAKRLDSNVMTQSNEPLSAETRIKEFEEQALPYTRLLFGAALTKTKNYADAEDLVQETFAKAFRAWNQFQKGTNLRAWLMKILENTYINMYNKKLKERGSGSLDDLEEFQIGAAESLTSRPQRSAEVEALNQMASKDVREALQNLSEEFRMVVYYAVGWLVRRILYERRRGNGSRNHIEFADELRLNQRHINQHRGCSRDSLRTACS